MFVDEKAVGETAEQANRKLKLSEAIRKGKQIVRYERQSSFNLCALGCAWAGIHGREMNQDDMTEILDRHGGSLAIMHLERFLGVEMGFSPDVTEQVHRKHCENIPALAIADWLEAKGL